MDACQHHLPDPSLRQAFDLPQDLLRSAAPDPAPGKGNDAVGAELVAAVLDLDIGPGMAGGLQLHVLVLGTEGQILHGIPSQQLAQAGDLLDRESFPLFFFSIPVIFFFLFIPGCQIPVQDLCDLPFLIVADGQIDGRVRQDFIFVRFHVAAHRDDQGVGVHLLCPVEHLTALAVSDIGHGAGIDHIKVRLPVEVYGLVAPLFQKLLHDIQFIAVDLASKVMIGDFFQ